MNKDKIITCLLVMFLCVFQVYKVKANDFGIMQSNEIVNVKRYTQGSEFKPTDKITVNYTIKPEYLEAKCKSNPKDILFVTDMSNNTNTKIQNKNYSKLDIVKNAIITFMNNFKTYTNVNFDLVTYGEDIKNIMDTKVYYDNIYNIIYNAFSDKKYELEKKLYLYCYDYNSGNIQYKYVSLYDYKNDLCIKYNENIYIKSNQSYVKVDNINDLVKLLKVDRNEIIKNLILNNLNPKGLYGNISYALRSAYEILNNNNGHDKYIIFMIDQDLENYSSNIVNLLDYVKKIDDSNIKIFVVQFGDVNPQIKTMYKEIAKITDGVYYNAINYEEINDIYNNIEECIKSNKIAKIYFHEVIPNGLMLDESEELEEGLVVNKNIISGYLDNVYYKTVQDADGNVIGYVSPYLQKTKVILNIL